MSEPSLVVAESTSPSRTRKTRPQAAGRTEGQSNQAAKPPVPKPIKTAVYLSPDVFLDLGVACVYERKTQSEIIEHLIKKALKPYGTSIRGDRIRFDEPTGQAKSTGDVDRQESDDHASESEHQEAA
jgi:hypothetical protein